MCSGLLRLILSGPCFDRQEAVVAPSNADLEFIRNSRSLPYASSDGPFVHSSEINLLRFARVGCRLVVEMLPEAVDMRVGQREIVLTEIYFG